MSSSSAGAALAALALVACAPRRPVPLAPELALAAGRLCLEIDELDLAIAALRQAQDGHRAAGDSRGAFEDADLLARAAWQKNDFVAALEHVAAARAAAEASGDRALRARARLSEGTVLATIGDAPRALELLAEASALLPPDDLAGRARVLIDRAGLLDDQGQGALATALFEEARRLATDAGADRLLVAAETNLLHRALREGRTDDAARHLAAARERRRAAGVAGPSEALLVTETELLRVRGDLAGAARALDEAERLELQPEMAWAVAQQRGKLEQARGDRAAAEKAYRAAIATIETLRAAAAPTEIRAPLLEERWGPYGDLFALLLDGGRPADALVVVAQAQGRMFADAVAAAAVDRAPGARRLADLATLVPALAAAPLGAPADAAALLARRGAPHVLVYFAGGDAMRLLLLDGAAVRDGGVQLPVDALARDVEAFAADPGDRARAAALGERLLPEGSLPVAGARLAIVATGPLARLPFAALRVGDRWLIERNELLLVPSLGALAARGDAPALTAVRPAAPREAVILADSRRDLRHADEELAAVVAATGATARSGRAATVAALRDAAGAPLLHVAGHSTVDARGGNLLLADGEVGAADIVRWRVAPRLVVLPTCGSASSHRGELWGSLAAAFLAAGSRDVVATLASVEDAAAAEFARRFYAAGGVADPVGATARAQREMLATHPATTWSAFVVTGL